MKSCSRCGSPLGEEMKFCSTCGQLVEQMPQVVQNQENPKTDPEKDKMNKIDIFMATFGEKFPEEQLMNIRQKLIQSDENKLMMVQTLPYKDPITVMLIAWFLGSFGVDRFMLNDTGLGVVKLLTCGGCGIWAIIDIFTASGRTKEYNYAKFNQTMGY